MDRLFAVLGATYGHRFTSLITDDETLDAMYQIWWALIGKYDVDTIKLALDRMAVEFTNWPPTAGQFAEICKAVQVVEYAPALPHTRTKSEEKVALKALAEMKRILKNANRSD